MSSIADGPIVRASIAGQEHSDAELESELCVGERERIELDGRRTFFRLRKQWSIALMTWISSFIVFHIAVTLGVGLKWLDFLEYQWLIPLITVENFLQIVGMGYVVVRFLYPLDLASRSKKNPRVVLSAVAAND